MSYIQAFCDKSYIVQIMVLVKLFFKLVCYIAPPIVIIVSIASFFKPMTTGDQEDLKASRILLVKRIIAGLVVMLLPTIISYVFNNFSNGNDVEFLACMESATQEKVEQLRNKEEQEEKAERKAQAAEDERILREAYEEEQKQNNARKQSFEEWKQEHQQNSGNINISNQGITAEAFKNKLASMNTPTIEQINSAAAQNGVSSDYVKIVIGTTFNEGYGKDPYLYYGWASAMINVPVTYEQMSGWDPNPGESNFYSRTNVEKGFNNATPEVLKSVYLAFTERNTKIVECNGMYSNTPAEYNLLYSSSVYNCSIYEKK